MTLPINSAGDVRFQNLANHPPDYIDSGVRPWDWTKGWSKGHLFSRQPEVAVSCCSSRTRWSSSLRPRLLIGTKLEGTYHYQHLLSSSTNFYHFDSGEIDPDAVSRGLPAGAEHRRIYRRRMFLRSVHCSGTESSLGLEI